MNAETLYEALSDPQSLERLTGTELEGLVQTYPFFSIGQLLLTKKRKVDPGTDSYQKQREYTQAFFRNPWWLYYQLELAAPAASKAQPGSPPAAFPFESIAPEAKAPVDATPAVVPMFTGPVVVPMMERPAEPPAAAPVFPGWPGVEDAGIPTLPVAAPADVRPVAEESMPLPIIDVTLPFMVDPIFPELTSSAPPPPAAAPPAPAPEPEELPLEEDEPLIPLDIPGPKALQPDPDGLTFEPLHMVDYFASQGIRLDPSELGNDRLGQHLMSFTEWLRKMKRIGPTERLHDDLDTATESEIQHLAAVANRQRDVIVTESMALVWALQGKYHKAIEIYHKLSLQHPEKRAYFAGKIDQINRH